MDLSLICTNCFRVKGKTQVCPHCGKVGAPAPEEAYHLRPGTILNERYLIGEVLGFGGFGVIYKALDIKLSVVVAVKEFFPTSLMCRVPGELMVSIFSGDKLEEYNKGIARFLEEARNMAAFAKNPYIVNILGFFTANRTAYIIMEYLDGITFDQFIKSKGGKISVDEALSVVLPVLDGLKVLHSKNIFHRDINPKNIMITSDNRIKIIDFGTAKFCDETEQTRTNVVTGGYAPPEQYQTKSEQGAFTDIYAVGATLYKAIVGETPVEAPERQENDELKRPSQLVASVPVNVDIAIMKSLALKPAQRFQSAEDLIFALTVSDNKNDYPEIEQHKRIVKRNIIVFSILAFIVMCVVAIVMLTKKNDVLFDQFKSLINSNESISVYIPYNDEDERNKLSEGYNIVCDDFEKYSKKQFGKNIDVEIKLIDVNDYDTVVSESDSSVCLFRNEYVKNKDVQRADLKKLVDSLDDYLYIDRYEKIYGPQYTVVPSSFYVYMMYANTSSKIDVSSVSSWNDYLIKAPSTDLLCVSNDSFDCLYKSLVNDNLNVDKATDVFSRTLKNGTLPTTSNAEQLFLNKDQMFFVGTSKNSKRVKEIFSYNTQNLFGNGDTWFAEFDEEWSVSGTVSKSKQGATVLFLRYLLGEDAQTVVKCDCPVDEVSLSLNPAVLTMQIDFNQDYNCFQPYMANLTFISDKDVSVEFADKFLNQAKKSGNTKESVHNVVKDYFN